jgi:hypothetical protein
MTGKKAPFFIMVVVILLKIIQDASSVNTVFQSQFNYFRFSASLGSYGTEIKSLFRRYKRHTVSMWHEEMKLLFHTCASKRELVH